MFKVSTMCFTDGLRQSGAALDWAGLSAVELLLICTVVLKNQTASVSSWMSLSSRSALLKPIVKMKIDCKIIHIYIM